MRRILSKANGRLAAAGLGVLSFLAIGANTTKAALIESWEGGLDGWQVPSPGGTNTSYTAATVTTPGVTDGVDSLAVGSSTSTSPNYSQMLLSPFVASWTSLLAGASAVSLDVYTPPGSFGFFLQFDIDVNNADTGFQSLDSFSYPSTTIGSETTITVPVSPTLQAEFAASSNPTQFAIQIGGGSTTGNETMYLDNLRTVPAPEPASLGLLASGFLFLGRRRRIAR